MKPLYIKKNGTSHKVAGIITALFPSYTLAEYTALDHKPLFWVRTDATYGAIPASMVSYDGGTVEDALDDSGWIQLNSTYPTWYRKKCGIVFIHLKVDGATPTDQSIGTLPDGYRPRERMLFPNYVSSDRYLNVRTTGEISLAGSGNDWTNIVASYPV